MKKVNVQTITANSGRKISYAEYGLRTGRPIIYAHNTLGSYIEGLYFDEVASEQGFRLIVINRPGIAYSDYQVNRNLFDFTYDVEIVMRSFNLKTVGMIGCGAGADYVLACAYKIPDLLNFAICISYDDRKNLKNPLNNAIFLSAYKLIQYFPALFPKIMRHIVSKEDQLVFSDVNTREIMLENVKKTMSGSQKGAYEDLNIASQKLTFNINDITMPIYFYNGLNKKLMPMKEMHRLIRLIPFAKLHTFDDPCMLYYLKRPHQEKIFNDISDILFRRSSVKEIMTHSF